MDKRTTTIFFNWYHETCHKIYEENEISYFSSIRNKKTVNFIDVENVITYQTEYTVLVYPRSMHCDDISG